MKPTLKVSTLLLLGVLQTAMPTAYAEDAPAQNPEAAAKPNKVTQAALAQGVISCIPRINQVSRYLGYTDNMGAVILAPPAQADQKMIPIIMEVPSENNTAYVAAEFAPNQANGCGATFDAVVYWPEKCEAVSSRFTGYKKEGTLSKSISVLGAGLYNKVFLMPAGEGCISIKKELVK
jgi:hypothetical protein